ncbi:MAG: D-alanine--D-alanine ligase [Parcubacteria group bacterium]|nr:D-alanine--D-alanine ligase [Parcubacteria group bacterium]
MAEKLRVAVLFGGRNSEHEVSLVSASSVIERLDPEKYDVIPIGITKEGKWIAGPESMQLLKSGRSPRESNALILPEPFAQASGGHALGKIDVIFPVLHGPYGEDGTVQGFLELTGIPYVGCGVLGSAVCMDKVMQKKVLAAVGFSQVPYVWFWASEWEERKRGITDELALGYPLFVKPANMGSSVGISKAHDQTELAVAVARAMQYDRKIIIEQGIADCREIEVAVLGNQLPRASVPGEIIPSNEFYDYDAKYVDGKSKAVIPAKLSDEKRAEIQDTATRAYRALDCEGMARVDFLLASDGTAYVNEVNTIPGFTAISMYPKLWEASGRPYGELLDELIQLALARTAEKKKLRVSFRPKEQWYAN